MSTNIRRAVSSDMFPVYKLLSRSTLNNRGLPLAARRRLFTNVWGGDQPYYGYLLEDDGKVAGFLGTLFSARTIDGKSEKFCEIHSWYVEDAYRNSSLNLFMPILSLRRSHTIINYTPTESVYEIGRKFGFGDLEENLVLLYPVPTSLAGVRMISRKWQVPDYLGSEDLAIFHDHEDVACHHLVFLDPTGDARPLYAVMKTMRRSWYEPFGRLLYTNDYERFAWLSGALCWRLCLMFRWQCIVSDARRFENLTPTARTRRIKRDIPSQFHSKTLAAQDIFPLYSQPLLQGYPLH
jgi:hypothetical protein